MAPIYLKFSMSLNPGNKDVCAQTNVFFGTVQRFWSEGNKDEQRIYCIFFETTMGTHMALFAKMVSP